MKKENFIIVFIFDHPDITPLEQELKDVLSRIPSRYDVTPEDRQMVKNLISGAKIFSKKQIGASIDLDIDPARPNHYKDLFEMLADCTNQKTALIPSGKVFCPAALGGPRELVIELLEELLKDLPSESASDRPPAH